MNVVQSRCRYCGCRGTIARGLARHHRGCICWYCARAGVALYDSYGQRTNVHLGDERISLTESMKDRGFRRSIRLLSGRWNRYCNFCELPERNEKFVLVGKRQICLRCINDVYRQMRRHEDNAGVNSPAIGLLEDPSYSNVMYQPGMRPMTGPTPTERCAVSFHRIIGDSSYRLLLHGTDGLRIGIVIGSPEAPFQLGNFDIAATPPRGATTHALPVPCCFCSQSQSMVPGLGVGRSGNVICYECIVLGYDAFREDGSTNRRREREPRRSPVQWANTSEPRLPRFDTCRLVSLARIALPRNG
jgi:hypothetical protein